MQRTERSALCGSRRELSNEYSLAKIGVDTAENEPLKVWKKIQFIIFIRLLRPDPLDPAQDPEEHRVGPVPRPPVELPDRPRRLQRPLASKTGP